MNQSLKGAAGRTNAHISPYFFVPNVIGYVRVCLMLAAFAGMRHFSGWTVAAYAASCLLDAVDGWAARKLGQVTRFGAVLDMITDRVTTAGLVVFLARIYADCVTPLFQALIALDFASHFMLMYAAISSGASSHKTVSPHAPQLIRLYYTSKLFLFVCCAGNEAFFVALYLNKWPALGSTTAAAIRLLAVGTLPVCVFKQLMNVLQLVEASRTLVRLDTKK